MVARDQGSGLGPAAPAAACQFGRSFADPVLIGDGVPAGGAALACAAYPLCLFELAQQREYLVAVGSCLLGERRCGQTVACGQ